MLATVESHAPGRAASTIAALEWCALHGAAVVALCPSEPPAVAPYDRILREAYAVTRPNMPATSRLIPAIGPRGGSPA